MDAESTQETGVWLFFRRADGKNFCKSCDWSENNVDSSTSNMWRHLGVVHRIAEDVLSGLKTAPKKSRNPLDKFLVPTNKSLLKLLTVKLVCLDLLPLSVTEGEGASFEVKQLIS